MFPSRPVIVLAGMVCCLVAFATGARAQNLLLNGSFETNNVTTVTAGTNSFLLANTTPPVVAAPWSFNPNNTTNNNGAGVAVGTTGSFALNGAIADGTAFAVLRKTATSTGLLAQSLTISTPGMYTLSFYEAGRASGTTTYGASTFNARITGATVGALMLTDTGGASSTTPARTTTAGETFTLVSYTFIVAAADTYTLLFTSTAASPVNSTSYLDNLSIVAVPEPSTPLQAGIAGALALLAFRKKLRRTA